MATRVSPNGLAVSLLASNKPRPYRQGRAGYVPSVAFSCGGNWLASGCREGNGAAFAAVCFIVQTDPMGLVAVPARLCSARRVETATFAHLNRNAKQAELPET